MKTAKKWFFNGDLLFWMPLILFYPFMNDTSYVEKYKTSKIMWNMCIYTDTIVISIVEPPSWILRLFKLAYCYTFAREQDSKSAS